MSLYSISILLGLFGYWMHECNRPIKRTCIHRNLTLLKNYHAHQQHMSEQYRHKTNDIYSWHHNRCGDVIYERRFKSVTGPIQRTYAGITIRATPSSFVESDRIEKPWASEKILIQSVIGSFVESGPGSLGSRATPLTQIVCRIRSDLEETVSQWLDRLWNRAGFHASLQERFFCQNDNLWSSM